MMRTWLDAGGHSVTRGYDLAIVGGGTAGIIAAKTAGGLGARVVLVERDRTGCGPGACRASP
jgi:pyruvate/2-oxoglutarate dehydrogenase complex dihydrolipoamide dehydrogenase (E3) component